MALKRRRILKQMLNLGFGSETVPSDAGGYLVGDKIGIHTFMGNQTVAATDFPGCDIGEQINNAYENLPSTGGTILIPAVATCYNFSTPIVLNTVNKPVVLSGTAPGGHTLTANQGGTCLNYTPTTSTTALTIDWTSKTGNGTFSAGCGLRDVALINNGACETDGGCGSSATGIKIGGTNGGAEHIVIENVKIQGFGTGLSNPNTSSQLVWGNVLRNVTFKHNTLGASFANDSEGWLLIGAKFVNGGRAIQTSAAVNLHLVSCHFDNHTIWGSGGSSTTGVCEFVGNAKVNLISPHFENVNKTTGANSHFIYSTSDLVWVGGEAIENSTSGTSDHWFWFVNGASIKGVSIGTQGAGVTNLFLNSGAGSFEWLNNNPSTITACPSNPTTLSCTEVRKTTNVVLTYFPTVRLGNSGGATILQPTAGAGSNTITFPAITGEVVVRQTRHFKVVDVSVSASSGTCPTAASVGATCTTASLTIPGSITMGDTSYLAMCQPTASLSGVPVIIRANRTAATTFTITIAALTAAAAELQTVQCFFADYD